jgi:uncharacterized protein (UPF0332 family)
MMICALLWGINDEFPLVALSYYAAFHHARYRLSDKWDIPISHSATAHAQVPNFFKQKNEGDIAKKLRRMRIARNGADYDDQMANLSRIARDTLKTAKEVVEDLERL